MNKVCLNHIVCIYIYSHTRYPRRFQCLCFCAARSVADLRPDGLPVIITPTHACCRFLQNDLHASQAQKALSLFSLQIRLMKTVPALAYQCRDFHFLCSFWLSSSLRHQLCSVTRSDSKIKGKVKPSVFWVL